MRATPAFHAEALKLLEAADRIPAPSLIGRTVYNFWQDNGPRPRALAADHPGRLRRAGARLGDGARPRRPVDGGKGQLGVEGRELPAAEVRPLPRQPVRRRRGRGARAGVRSRVEDLHARRLRPAARQAERRLAGRRHPDRGPRVDPRRGHPLRLPLHRQDAEARTGAGSGDGGLPRRGRRRGRRSGGSPRRAGPPRGPDRPGDELLRERDPPDHRRRDAPPAASR